MTSPSAVRNVDQLIGETVHLLMWNARITQTEMGRRIGLGQSHLSKKLRGEMRWYANEVAQVAQILGVTPGELFGDIPPKRRPGRPIDSSFQPLDGGPSNEKVWSSILQRGSHSVITRLPTGDPLSRVA